MRSGYYVDDETGCVHLMSEPKPLYAHISEKAFTAQVITLARHLGWLVAHFRPGMTKRGRWVTAGQGDSVGFPDIIAIKPGRAIMAELKAAKGRATVEQLKWLETAKEAGMEAYLWKPQDITQIERILRK